MIIIIKKWENVTVQLIRVPESVMYVHLSVDTCKLPTREQHVANRNCRKALSLTIRYGYLTAGDGPAFCVPPPSLQQKMMGFVHCESGNRSATLNSRPVRLLAAWMLCKSPAPLTLFLYFNALVSTMARGYIPPG